MKNKKLIMIIIVFLFIIGVMGIFIFSIANTPQNIDTINETNNTPNTNSIELNNSSNSTSIDKNLKYDIKKNAQTKNKQISKEVSKPKLISEKTAIRIAKKSLKKSNTTVDKDISASLVKKDGKYYWIVEFFETSKGSQHGRPIMMYINAEK